MGTVPMVDDAHRPVSLSVLRPAGPSPGPGGDKPEPEFFHDLNLDQVVQALKKGREDYPGLPQLFYDRVADLSVARYRQDIAADLVPEALRGQVERFTFDMRQARAILRSGRGLDSIYFKQAWFLDGAERYCRAVATLGSALQEAPITSKGLVTLRDYVKGYSSSGRFSQLRDGAVAVRGLFRQISYTTLVRNGRVTVGPLNEEPDYSQIITSFFDKFRQTDVADTSSSQRNLRDSNHVQGWVLDKLAKLYPSVFQSLADYCRQNSDFIDPTLARFEQEVQLYLSYLAMAKDIEASGLKFCLPSLSERLESERVDAAFDLALALIVTNQGGHVIPNDIELKPGERVIVVSGPNQGGKTTFARTFGQLHYIAGLGLPVPAREAELLLADQVFTHFERPELLIDLRGKLEDELERVRDILLRATDRSVIVMNESFSSTSLADNRFIGTHVLQDITARGSVCLYVTFLDELSRLSEVVTSYVSEVTPDDPSTRTFKVVRRPADGRAFALTLASKYKVTYEQVKERMATV